MNKQNILIALIVAVLLAVLILLALQFQDMSKANKVKLKTMESGLEIKIKGGLNGR